MCYGLAKTALKLRVKQLTARRSDLDNLIIAY